MIVVAYGCCSIGQAEFSRQINILSCKSITFSLSIYLQIEIQGFHVFIIVNNARKDMHMKIIFEILHTEVKLTVPRVGLWL